MIKRRKPPELRKAELIMVRMTASEREKLVALARSRGVTESAVARMAINCFWELNPAPLGPAS
jgi:hypothetical protein